MQKSNPSKSDILAVLDAVQEQMAALNRLIVQCAEIIGRTDFTPPQAPIIIQPVVQNGKPT
jgi:hypothetical protein